MTGTRVAAIDFGTNTARLLIADRRPDGSFKLVRIEREIVRMGGGFSKETGLSADAIQRGSHCLQRFAGILNEYGVRNPRAVATSAVRDAINGQSFIGQIYRQTGIALTVIDGEQEGILTLTGVVAGLDCQPDHLMVFDVGGGSTEYTLSHGGEAVFVRSIPLGVVRLTEGTATAAEMSEKIEKELCLLSNELSDSLVAAPDQGTLLVGTAGTATTLAAISMKMATYDYRRVHNSILSIDEIRRIYRLLLPLSPEVRLEIPGLEKGREDLIIAGMLITLNTMERFGFRSFKVSDYGLLEGLIVVDGLPGA
ncbi:MAG: exopolyphosphatase [Geobacteraceae bacterium]|nr:exopolyphosphatase [Geobacteraceae bacterium]